MELCHTFCKNGNQKNENLVNLVKNLQVYNMASQKYFESK